MESKEERSRRQVGNTSKYEIKFLGRFKDGMKWGSTKKIRPNDGIYHVINNTKNSTHLIPVGGTMWDRFSVPTKLMKIVRLVRE